MLAPLIVFAYNRPDHLEKTLAALAKNPEAKYSNVFVYIDGPKNEAGKEKNRAVENVAESFAKGFFSSVEIRNAAVNRGLARSVIAGVTEIIEQYGKVIVTEDDAVSANTYIKYMNEALDAYEHDTSIWSIGGYTVPMRIPEDYNADVIVTQRSSSYAWATWKDRWEKIDWSVSDYNKFRWNFAARRQFNLWGDDRASMLDDQMLGRVNSWAIRFDYAMFKHGMYNVVPRQSLIHNIGHDGSGTHSTQDSTAHDVFAVSLPEDARTFELSHALVDERIRQEFIKPFYTSRTDLFKRFVGNLVFRWRKHG